METDAVATEPVHRFSYRTAVVARFVLAMLAISGILFSTGLVSVTVTIGALVGGIFGISMNRTVEISATGVRLGRRSWQSWDAVRYTRKRNRDTLVLGDGRTAPGVPLNYFATSWRTDDIGIALRNTVPPGQLRIDLGFDAAAPLPPPPPPPQGYVHYQRSAGPT